MFNFILEVVNYMNYVYNQNKNKNISEDPGINIKIIICDDENVITNSVKRLIETFCSEQNREVFVATCFNGVEVINRIVEDSNRNICYSLLLIDEELPYLWGSDVIKILKKMQKNKELYTFPIYSVTAHDNEDFINELLRIGADGIIKKPMNKKSLSSILTKLKLLSPK